MIEYWPHGHVVLDNIDDNGGVMYHITHEGPIHHIDENRAFYDWACGTPRILMTDMFEKDIPEISFGFWERYSSFYLTNMHDVLECKLRFSHLIHSITEGRWIGKNVMWRSLSDHS